MKKPFRGGRQYIRKVQKELTDKKVPKLEYFTIIGKFDDNTVREFSMQENTRRAILNIIVMIEGKISVSQDPIDGITLTKNSKP